MPAAPDRGRPARKRLDERLVELGLAPTRARARAVILAGKVTVDGRMADKAGTPCAETAEVRLKSPDHPYVSRGGVKLAGALDVFGAGVEGRLCLDIGTSTGGFVDCLLQRGARHVTAVDTGNVIDDRLRRDPRVTYLRNTNARSLTPAMEGAPFDLVTIDVSFISVHKVLPAMIPLLQCSGRFIVLIKPQFEAGRREVGKGGIVRDLSVLQRVLIESDRSFRALHLAIAGIAESVLAGADGNREFFFDLHPGVDGFTEAEVQKRIADLLGISNSG